MLSISKLSKNEFVILVHNMSVRTKCSVKFRGIFTWIVNLVKFIIELGKTLGYLKLCLRFGIEFNMIPWISFANILRYSWFH